MSEMRYTSEFVIEWFDCSNDEGYSARERGPCEISSGGNVLFSYVSRIAYNRLKGPAIIRTNGTVEYNTSQSSARHRTDGPAKIHDDGSKEYWVDDNELTADEFFLKYGVL